MDSPGAEYVKDDHPSEITPHEVPKRTWSDRGQAVRKALTTKEGWIGNYSYSYLFTPKIPFMKTKRSTAPFFGLNDKMPILLALILGLQHSLAMLAGVISPPIVLSGAANFTSEMQSYLVSTSLIVCAILSCIQITRFHIWKTPYYVGTGLIVSGMVEAWRARSSMFMSSETSTVQIALRKC